MAEMAVPYVKSSLGSLGNIDEIPYSGATVSLQNFPAANSDLNHNLSPALFAKEEIKGKKLGLRLLIILYM